MQSYKSDNGIPPIGLIMLLVATVVGGVVLGAITAYVSQYFYLIVLFPLILGAALGFVIAAAVKAGKIRNVPVAVVFALLGAVILYGTYRALQYEFVFVPDWREELETNFGDQIEITDEIVDETIASVLEEETGSTGVWGYIKLTAQDGITISRASSSSDSGLTLKGTIAWIYWLLEFGAIAFIAAGMAMSEAEKPFSAEANEWYSNSRYIGSLDYHNWMPFWEALKSGQYDQARAMFTESEVPVPRYDVYVHTTPTEASEVVVALTKATADRKGNLKSDVEQYGVISAMDVARLMRS